MSKYTLLALVLVLIWTPTLLCEWYFDRGVQTRSVSEFNSSIWLKSSTEALANRDALLKALPKTPPKTPEPSPPDTPKSQSRASPGTSTNSGTGSTSQSGGTNTGNTLSGSTNTGGTQAENTDSGASSQTWGPSQSFDTSSTPEQPTWDSGLQDRAAALRELQKSTKDYLRPSGKKDPDSTRSLLNEIFGGGQEGESRDY